MNNMPNIPALGVHATPASVEPHIPHTIGKATDPNLQNNGPAPELAHTRVATAITAAAIPLVAESYAFIKHIKGTPTPPVFNKLYTPARITTKAIDLPFRLAVYTPTIAKPNAKTSEKAPLITKAATQIVDLSTEVGLALGNRSNAQLEHIVVPAQRQSTRSGSQGSIPMQDLPGQSAIQGTGQNNPAFNNMDPVPSAIPRTAALDEPPASSVIQRSSTPSSGAPFVRGGPGRQPINFVGNLSLDQPFIRNGPGRQPVNPVNNLSLDQPFIRNAPSRQPVRGPKPILPPSSSATTWVKGLNHVSNAANAVGAAIDIYFGVKAIADDPEPLAKVQGGLFIASGATGIGATLYGSASLLGYGGTAAAAAVPALSAAAAGTGLVAAGITSIPLTHGVDNKHRAYKLHNDLMYDVRQIGLADEQLAQRTGERLKSDLGRLKERYGIKAKTVWLNNNSADLMNEMNSPNNSGSGQWKPDANGNVWSNFQGKYIRIGGTPHQQTASLDLEREHDGSSSVPTPRETIHIAGDESPDKKPLQVKALAGEPAIYATRGWRHNTQQPWLYKDYGYQTSGWGHYWETSIPATVSGGPLYVAHDATPQGKDRVILIEDTRLSPAPPFPSDRFTEDAVLQFDGKDGQRLTRQQMAALQLEGALTKLPVLYPISNLPHVRSPDAFDRTVATDPSVRTVVSLPYLRHPLKIVARNANDVLDLPNMPEADIHITLPAIDATNDKRQLGLYDASSLRRLTPKDAATQVYAFPNKKTLTVQAHDAAIAARFVQKLS